AHQPGGAVVAGAGVDAIDLDHLGLQRDSPAVIARFMRAIQPCRVSGASDSLAQRTSRRWVSRTSRVMTTERSGFPTFTVEKAPMLSGPARRRRGRRG